MASKYMNFTLKVDTRFPEWRSLLGHVLQSVQGISYSVDGQRGIVQVAGKIHPFTLIDLLRKEGLHAGLSPVDAEHYYRDMHKVPDNVYGYHHNGYLNNTCPRVMDSHWDDPQQKSQYAYFPSIEPTAQYFPQPPAPKPGFVVGEPQCTIM